MKRVWSVVIILLCLGEWTFAADKLRVYAEKSPETMIQSTSDYREITDTLNSIGIRFEQWQANQILPEDFKEADIMDAYREDIERLVRENGYQSVDVVKMVPHSPKKDEIRKKFLNEHAHSEDEVRFFVEGSGLFYLHVGDKVYLVLCESGDLISIPAGYAHWFDMGEEPFFTAIRFFIEPAGWIAQFTGSGIAQNFPKYGDY
jgi:1,2-dihydroxy-3-keto-5-methylthiopentene dioxygenase